MPIPGTPSLSLAGFLLLVAAGYWGAIVYLDAFGMLPWGPRRDSHLTEWE